MLWKKAYVHFCQLHAKKVWYRWKTSVEKGAEATTTETDEQHFRIREERRSHGHEAVVITSQICGVHSKAAFFIFITLGTAEECFRLNHCLIGQEDQSPEFILVALEIQIILV